MKKQLIGFILPVLICVLTPLEATAQYTFMDGFQMLLGSAASPVIEFIV